VSLIRPLVRNLVPYTPGEQPKIKGLIKLNTNENPYSPSPKVLQAVKAASDGRLRLYPDPTAQPLREQLARLQRPRVDADSRESSTRIAGGDASSADAGDVRRRQRNGFPFHGVAHETRRRLVRRRFNAVRATATSSNGRDRSPITWYFSCPLPASTTTSAGAAS